ncbi:MAG TPA: recombinase-like helix-turn-helix domain-containing protein [Stellaceae bacterium]|nr:recombinase-like helix-turn-helix domain-containing protein [Stellaceae bacterium]
MSDYNPFLGEIRPSDKGTPDGIEMPDKVTNIGWQTRPAPPTAYEDRLADALQAIFAEEIYDLPRILARLNAAGIEAPAGAAGWTDKAFCAEMHRLAR